MDIITVAGIGVLAALLAGELKVLKAEYSMYLSVAAMLLIVFYSIGKLSGIFSLVERIQSYLPVQETYISTLLRIIGITYVAEFASHICRDAGYAAIGSQIEVFGKLSVLAVSMPILAALLETLETLFA